MDAGPWEGAGAPHLPASVSTLVRLLDCRGQPLQPHRGTDQQLRFDQGGNSGAAGRQAWVLSVAAGCYTLQHAASGGFLATSVGVLRLAEAPEALQLFMDLDQRVALLLAGGACLQSGAGGAALAGALPLSRDRASKLFRLEEVALPLHALRAWPLRACLRCEHGGGYLSAAAGGALSTTAPVACCSEEFVLAPGGAAPLRAHGGALVAPACAVWAGDGRRLLSLDAGTGRVLLRRQHSVAGRERFTLRLSPGGLVSLLAEAPPQQGQQQGGEGGSPPSEAPLAVRHGVLAECAGGKPARFALELAGGKPTLLLTAHGRLLRCRDRDSRPCGALLPPPPPPGDAGAALPGGSAAARAAVLASAAWLLEHHGDDVYSLRHGATGRSLHLDDSGTPRLETRPGAITLPDERLLFWVEPAWVALEASPQGGTTGSSSSSAGRSYGGSGGGKNGSSGGLWDGGEGGATMPPPGFARPDAAGATAAGFSLRSVWRLDGRHLYLSALPDGLLTTVYAGERPTRWELFSPIDHQTLLESPLSLLDRLPCAPGQPPQQAPLRRATSMQALSGGGGGPARRSNDGCAAAPALSTVPEHRPASPAPSLLPPQLQQGLAGNGAPPRQAGEGGAAGQPPRRCQSESALAALQGDGGRRPPRPLWLAQLLSQPRRPEGWGPCSAASLQELACRQLCASLVRRYHQQYGGQALPPELVPAVEAELSGHLPEEVAERIGAELRLLARPPPATKLSLHQLARAAAAAEGKRCVPAWAAPHLEAPGLRAEATLLQWQPTEAFLCSCCCGASGALLPLDPYVNPAHHLFLHAMERRARGGGRVRLRARRRRHDGEDPLLLALHTGRLFVLAWALGKALAAVFASGGARR